ncbi:uncharacterized protein VTP21DRAFT_2406 [Calcarisporiella thermophila]|uniref:uncharacterized protein n=1 Tax=Calcarisporiella thermophila TaxID=911321 RepID=UPI0037439735
MDLNPLTAWTTLSHATPTTPAASSTPPTSYTFRRADFSFLPQLYAILEKFGKQDELPEVMREFSKLNDMLIRARRIIQELPGADLSKEELERVLGREKEVLAAKREQLQEYVKLPVFELLKEIETPASNPMDQGSN